MKAELKRLFDPKAEPAKCIIVGLAILTLGLIVLRALASIVKG